jgi:phosphatidylglycerophosphate synthase
MRPRPYYIINSITLYRLLAAPVLIFLVFSGNINMFKWLIAFSFFTDAIDGFLARKFKVVSRMGSKLDSIADDLTMTAGIFGVFLLKPYLVQQELFLIITMLVLLFIQMLLAFVRYRKMTSFHTYIAKVAAVLQACFLILLFFLPDIPFWLFYFAAAFTILDLIEEIILIFVLPGWKTDVKGLFWVLRSRSGKNGEGLSKAV